MGSTEAVGSELKPMTISDYYWGEFQILSYNPIFSQCSCLGMPFKSFLEVIYYS